MYELFKLLHLAAAALWLGGMGFAIWALRPVVIAQLAPPQRLPLMTAVLGRFFGVVWFCIAALLLTGAFMWVGVDAKLVPKGWHAMMGLGLVMFGIFGHLFFGPFRRLKIAVAAADWPEAGRRLGQIHPLVVINFALGWLAIAAVFLLR